MYIGKYIDGIDVNMFYGVTAGAKAEGTTHLSSL